MPKKLISANETLASKRIKDDYAAELISTGKQLANQIVEREKSAAELLIAIRCI